MLDLAGVEQAQLEPPTGQPAEGVAHAGREVVILWMARPEDRPGHDAEGAVDLAGLVGVTEAGLLLDRSAQLIAERRGDGLDQREVIRRIAGLVHRVSPGTGTMATLL